MSVASTPSTNQTSPINVETAIRPSGEEIESTNSHRRAERILVSVGDDQRVDDVRARLVAQLPDRFHGLCVPSRHRSCGRRCLVVPLSMFVGNPLPTSTPVGSAPSMVRERYTPPVAGRAGDRRSCAVPNAIVKHHLLTAAKEAQVASFHSFRQVQPASCICGICVPSASTPEVMPKRDACQRTKPSVQMSAYRNSSGSNTPLYSVPVPNRKLTALKVVVPKWRVTCDSRPPSADVVERRVVVVGFGVLPPVPEGTAIEARKFRQHRRPRLRLIEHVAALDGHKNHELGFQETATKRPVVLVLPTTGCPRWDSSAIMTEAFQKQAKTTSDFTTGRARLRPSRRHGKTRLGRSLALPKDRCEMRSTYVEPKEIILPNDIMNRLRNRLRRWIMSM